MSGGPTILRQVARSDVESVAIHVARQTADSDYPVTERRLRDVALDEPAYGQRLPRDGRRARLSKQRAAREREAASEAASREDAIEATLTTGDECASAGREPMDVVP